MSFSPSGWSCLAGSGDSRQRQRSGTTIVRIASTLHVNADELAKLEANRAMIEHAGVGCIRAPGALRHTPIPYVPEVDRKSWEELIAHLNTLGGLARHLQQLPPAKPQGGIGGMFGKGSRRRCWRRC